MNPHLYSELHRVTGEELARAAQRRPEAPTSRAGSPAREPRRARRFELASARLRPAFRA